MNISKFPERYFSENQYLLADSAYKNDQHMVTVIKGPRGETVNGLNFNYCAAQSRVRVEHAIGILKGRWSFLREVQNQMHSESEAKTLGKWVYAAIVLHNLLANLGDQWTEMFDDTPNRNIGVESWDGPEDLNIQSHTIMRDRVLPFTLEYHHNQYGSHQS